MGVNNLHPFTLNRYLGTLTSVWVVPLSLPTLTADRRLQTSMLVQDSEFDKRAGDFSPVPSDQCSTPLPTKDEAVLRYISKGTSYYQIRLAFHPYSQVTREVGSHQR